MSKTLYSEKLEKELYRFGIKQGVSYLSSGKLMGSISKLLCPIHYTRYKELPIALYMLDPQPNETILDISSPKILPVYCAWKYQTKIHTMDIIDKPIEEAEFFKEKLSLNNLTIVKGDARNLDYPDNFFDKIFSVSVFEHIAPAKKGEIPAMLETVRILKPGGILVLTLAFANEYFEEYRQGDVYERQAGKDESIFFQRFYDEKVLHENIIAPSGLEVLEKIYIGETIDSQTPGSTLANYINSGRLQNAVFGHAQRFMAKRFLVEKSDLNKVKKPIIICLKLKKAK